MMSLNEQIIKALKPLKIDITVVEHPLDSTGKLPDSFLVINPQYEEFALHADDKPDFWKSTVELALFTKGNYLPLRDKLTRLLVKAEITITERRYIEMETDTGYHHYIFGLESIQNYEED